MSHYSFNCFDVEGGGVSIDVPHQIFNFAQCLYMKKITNYELKMLVTFFPIISVIMKQFSGAPF